MPETQAKAKTQKAPILRGVRAIFWNPEKDYRLGGMKVPDGCENVRQYAFSYVDAEKSKAAQSSAEQTLGAGANYTPAFRLFMLTPGLNWIEAGEWEAVLKASSDRYSADLAEVEERGTVGANPVNEIEQLLDGRAIVVYEPAEKVAQSGQFTGSLEDYPLAEIRKFSVEINDPKALNSFIEGISDYDMKQVLKNRLASVEQGY